jgi:hypothetical protein
MLPNLPNLNILPLPSLILHEDHDKQRTLPLVEKLRAQGILRNPPIVMPLDDGSDRYMVLDGANRVTSLQEMDFPHIVAQVVDREDPNVALMTWNHVIWGMSVRDLIAGIRDVVGIKLMPIDRNDPNRPEIDCVPVLLQLADERTYLACTTENPLQQVAYLHGIVDTYKDRAFLDRTSEQDVTAFNEVYKDLTALVIFPHFENETILNLAGQGCMLPTGITRFAVSPRALHLNYPLHELSSAKPIEYKEAYLQRWVQERAKNKGIRYYAEETFLFDE